MAVYTSKGVYCNRCYAEAVERLGRAELPYPFPRRVACMGCGRTLRREYTVGSMFSTVPIRTTAGTFRLFFDPEIAAREGPRAEED